MGKSTTHILKDINNPLSCITDYIDVLYNNIVYRLDILSSSPPTAYHIEIVKTASLNTNDVTKKT